MVEVLSEERDRVLIFGDNQEWAVSLDDGCLRFHPNYKDNPDTKAIYIWSEAWSFIEGQGGFSEVVRVLATTTAPKLTVVATGD